MNTDGSNSNSNSNSSSSPPATAKEHPTPDRAMTATARRHCPEVSTASYISSFFSSSQDPSPAVLPISTTQMRRNMRRYSVPAVSTPDSTFHSNETTTTVRSPIYSNCIFPTSADVLARAGEGEDEDLGESGGKAGTDGNWTKQQYRDEAEKLREKE